MCQYLVFFIISISFGLNKRLLHDPAKIDGERRSLGMFGHHQPRRYEDYFAQGHSHARRRSHKYQTPVGQDDKNIEVHKLTGHFPFDKQGGDSWEQILTKSQQEADAMAAKSKAEDDAEMKKDNDKESAEKKQEDNAEKAKDAKEDEDKKKKEEDEKKKEEEEKEKEKNGDDSGKGPDDSAGAGKAGEMNGKNPPPGAPANGGGGAGGAAAAPGKHGLTENQNYVPDTVPKKKACEFTPANCFCGARPTQQMDLLCASKKREYCGWFCKHKMGGREGKPKTGAGQFAGGDKPKELKPGKRANPEGCPKPALKQCESIYSDPNSPDYVGDGYAPPGANCVCHIDQKTGHAVITDLPNSAALPGANAAGGAAPAASGAPAASAAPGAPGATGGAPATSGAPAEAANSNGAGPDSGNSGNPAVNAINGAANTATQGIQDAQNTANAAGAAATDTVNAASQAADKVKEESKGMWHHAKGFAGAAAGHVSNAASGIWNGVKGVGKAIFGDEAESEVQGKGPIELSFSGGEHPTRGETSVSNGINEVFEDDEVALGLPGDFGVHR